jgi:hypothetical protein
VSTRKRDSRKRREERGEADGGPGVEEDNGAGGGREVGESEEAFHFA